MVLAICAMLGLILALRLKFLAVALAFKPKAFGIEHKDALISPKSTII